MGDWTRSLTADEQQRVEAAREKAFVLYEGRLTPHRSCGIAMAETFGLRTAPYQALRRGGITGCGECGVVVGARMVLGELFGDPDPTGGVTEALRTAMVELEQRYRGVIGSPESIVCNDLTRPFADFAGPERAAMCTSMASEVAALVAEVAVRNGLDL